MSTAPTLDLQDTILEAERLREAQRRQWEEKRLWELRRVISSQRKECPTSDPRFYDLFCCNCDFQATEEMSLEQFTRFVFKEGWRVMNVDTGRVECPSCTDPIPDENSFAAQYRSDSGGRYE